MEEFKFKRAFLYECGDADKYNNQSRKAKALTKYKRIQIEKKSYDKNNNFKIKLFSL